MSTNRLCYPVLVISYKDDIRNALAENLRKLGVQAVTCDSFCAAEDTALRGIYNGILVDLQSIIKAKAEDKVAACSLTGFFPTLRVRVLGTMIIPMAMPGDAKQDSTLADFVNKTCATFQPRRLRHFRRKEMNVSLELLHQSRWERSFTMNVSWGGVFIADAYPERFIQGDRLSLAFKERSCTTPVIIRWIQPWGRNAAPGIGVEFQAIDQQLEEQLVRLLKHDKANARDRMVAR